MATDARGLFAGEIRDFRSDDLPELQDFWVVSWAKTMPDIDFEARRPWLAAHLQTLAASGVQIRVAVAEGGRLSGFVTIDPASGHLDQICVAPDWWGGGVAEALVAAARGLSPDRLELDVNADNPRAIRFYAREGFVATSQSLNPRSGLPILRMVWTRK